jgi:hypothetical protein
MKTRLAVLATDNPEEFSRAAAAAAHVAKVRGYTRCYPLLTNEVERARLAPVSRHFGLEWVRFADVQSSNGAAAKSGGAGSSRHLLFVARKSAHATVATYYAKVAGKRVVYVDDWTAAFNSLAPGTAESVMLVDDFHVFNKTFLSRILDHPVLKSNPSGTGILTALNPASLGSLVLRMILARHYPAPAASRLPELYRVVTEHGNEMHMHLETGEVLCGALNADGSHEEAIPFDCVPTCPHANRIPASSLAVHHLLISSCNTFTLGDGLAPPEFSLLVNMLAGWCSSVMAPIKHALSGPRVPMLIEALARSGFSLGAIANRMNSIAVLGEEPDPAYVLLGDPEITVADSAQVAETASAHDIGGAIAMDIPLDGRPAVEVALPSRTIERVLDPSGKLVVVPLCETLRAPDVYFCFRRVSAAEGWNLILFSSRELPHTRAQFFLSAPTGLHDRQHALAFERIRSLRRLAAFGVPDTVIQGAEDDILTQVRFAAGYPRAIDLAIGDLVIRNLDAILSEQFAALRHAVLEQLIELTATRLWISQNYGRFYSSVRRQKGIAGACIYCSCETTEWVYEDKVEGRAARTLVICARCGIVADHPQNRQIDVRMEIVKDLPLDALRVRISFRNVTDHPIEASIAVPFHEWRPLGVTGGLEPQRLSLAAGEVTERAAVFTFTKPLPDYMQDIHVFTLTEDFELSCFTQKMISRHNAALKRRPAPAHAAGTAS